MRLLSDRIPEVSVTVLSPSRLVPTGAQLARRGQPRQIIHAVGRRALAVALFAANADVIFQATRFPRRGDVAYVRAALMYRQLRIVCESDAERRAWVTGGVPIDACTLIRPGVSLAIPPDARKTARDRLGYRDTDRVIFSPLPPLGSERSDAVWAGCLLNILDSNTRLLGWAEAGLESLHALRSRLLGDNVLTILEDDAPDVGFAAADAILLPPGESTSPTLIAMAMASGKPIVGQVMPQTCELIEDRHTALMTGGRTPKILAERVIDVLADAEQARKIADRARAEAYEHFLLSRMIADYRTLYGQPSAAEASTPATPAVAHA
ncbi:MAG: hypothetical protein JWM57_2471 [Phycisphaerales bacterium]|nr:hypothetical protein [Phycisphaerales bacterium]